MGSKTGLFKKQFFYILFSLFIFWIILFEFILPGNNILPRPWTILISIPALFEDYHFLTNFFTSISAIYLPGVLAYLLMYVLRGYIFKESGILKRFIEFISYLTIFTPALLLAVPVVYWFPHSFFAEYVFSFLVSVFWWIITIESNSKSRNEYYLVAFKSFGADKSFLDQNVLWEEIKPKVFKKLFRYHLHLWAIILIYEFIADGYGLGVIIKQTISYHDLSALTLIIVIIPVLIFAGYSLLNYLEDKFVFWEAE
jgi:ABC-type nitrate/sulfonate/bicarbonate transport system permease component